jgi:hypothetical protein
VFKKWVEYDVVKKWKQKIGPQIGPSAQSGFYSSAGSAAPEVHLLFFDLFSSLIISLCPWQMHNSASAYVPFPTHLL